jgi:hypothetical protein
MTLHFLPPTLDAHDAAVDHAIEFDGMILTTADYSPSETGS